MVADHTPGQTHSQGPGFGVWSWQPSLLQLPGETFALPGHIQDLYVPYCPVLLSDAALAWYDRQI
jgi:hypothetical protein